jgi:hypothetical protein
MKRIILLERIHRGFDSRALLSSTKAQNYHNPNLYTSVRIPEHRIRPWKRLQPACWLHTFRLIFAVLVYKSHTHKHKPLGTSEFLHSWRPKMNLEVLPSKCINRHPWWRHYSPPYYHPPPEEGIETITTPPILLWDPSQKIYIVRAKRILRQHS